MSQQSMPPNDYGIFSLVSNNQKISINELLRNVKQQLKKELLGAKLEVLGVGIKLIESKTGFGGTRLWFECPVCSRRVADLYEGEQYIIACNKCLNLKYKSSRFKGMLEEN